MQLKGGHWRGSNLDGGKNVFDGVFLWELQKGRNTSVFSKAICLLDFFLNKIDGKG